jgi:hypothetical protein
LFGLDKGKKKRNPKVTQEEKPIDYREVQYIGGLTSYPKSEDIGIYSYNERFLVWFTKRESWLKVPYSRMVHIGNSYQTKVSLGWLIGLGILFLPYLNSIIIKRSICIPT